MRAAEFGNFLRDLFAGEQDFESVHELSLGCGTARTLDGRESAAETQLNNLGPAAVIMPLSGTHSLSQPREDYKACSAVRSP